MTHYEAIEATRATEATEVTRAILAPSAGGAQRPGAGQTGEGPGEDERGVQK
ncbi:hypothetical protein BGZ68_007859, partial [Mortierella alpina]